MRAWATSYVVLERSADPGTDPGADPTIAIAGGTVAAGGKVTVTGAGFAPTESLQVTPHSDPVDLALAASDAWGAFSTVVTVPRDTPPGAHRIEVRGAASGSAWANRTATAAAAPPGTLAVTGADVPILLLKALALLALVAGAALRHVRSRLERHRPQIHGAIRTWRSGCVHLVSNRPSPKGREVAAIP